MAQFDVMPQLFLYGAATAAILYYEKSPFALDDPPTHGAYSYAAYIGYKFTPHVTSRLGYTQDDNFIKDGRYEVNLYNSDTSRYFLALDLIL